MSLRFEQDPEEARRQAEAHLLLLHVALALIDDARRLGAFETDEEKLAARVAALADELGSGARPATSERDGRVEATPLSADRIELSADFSESSSVFETLRADGVLLGGGTSMSISAQTIDEAELSPEEAEEMRQAVAEFEARQARPQFRGEHFLRALAAEPQPDAEFQILAAELFDDGFLVHYTHDQEPGSLESIVSDDPRQWLENRHGLRVEDDLGTEYFESPAGGSGGVQVVHGASAFAPAVAPQAGTLRITTPAGTVELPL
jgi:hypothetical protein